MSNVVSLPIFQPKPITRRDCLPGGLNVVRPCRWENCKYHLKAEDASCVLDVADQGGATLEEVGNLLGVSRERVRQIEAGAARKLQAKISAWKPPS